MASAANFDKVLQVDRLTVDYGRGKKRLRAVDGLSFDVAPGECVGFIGPNGAGKTTTIKTIMGFVFASGGSVEVFGQPAGRAACRQRMGYLPEVALYYPFMKARELLELYGGLHGLSKAHLKQRIPTLLEEVGLAGRSETLLRQFSKGMQQRLGIAQAIITQPELLVFDEMSSGLDPVGRFDLRQVLLKMKKHGTTIFFSSHDLTEVEDLCDRVLIVNRGRIIHEDNVENLLTPLNRFEIVYSLSPAATQPRLPDGCEVTTGEQAYRCEVVGSQAYAQALKVLLACDAKVQQAQAQQQSLEQYFMQLISADNQPPDQHEEADKPS